MGSPGRSGERAAITYRAVSHTEAASSVATETYLLREPDEVEPFADGILRRVCRRDPNLGGSRRVELAYRVADQLREPTLVQQIRHLRRDASVGFLLLLLVGRLEDPPPCGRGHLLRDDALQDNKLSREATAAAGRLSQGSDRKGHGGRDADGGGWWIDR
jgi:hypothetical protein